MPPIHHVLVLCEGNHCRSPLAEALLRRELGPRVEVVSAGLDALVDRPAHPETLRRGEALGLDLAKHRGRMLTPELALRADLILVMDQAQKSACEERVPSARGRVYLLGHWLPSAEQEISDPIGRDPETHQRSHDHIQRAVVLWCARLALPSRRIP